jgi:hypothetical protein
MGHDNHAVRRGVRGENGTLPLNLDLSGSRAKVARANQHLEILKAELKAIYGERNPYTVRLDRHSDGRTYSLVLRAGELPQHPGLILGDAIHNLRCALDYIIVALVEKSGASLTAAHQFPIFDDQGEYEAKAPRMLNGIRVGLDIIESLQPFHQEKPRHDEFFAVGYFSNADKHRIIASVLPVIGDLSGGVRPWPSRVENLPVPSYIGSNEEVEVSRITYDRLTNEVDFEGKISVAPYFGAPAFGKHGKGIGAPFGLFQHASVRIASVLDLFEKL